MKVNPNAFYITPRLSPERFRNTLGLESCFYLTDVFTNHMEHDNETNGRRIDINPHKKLWIEPDAKEAYLKLEFWKKENRPDYATFQWLSIAADIQGTRESYHRRIQKVF